MVVSFLLLFVFRALAAEQGKPIPERPIIFFKPTTSYIVEGQNIKIPTDCLDMFYEVELGIVIGKTASDVSEDTAMDYVAGFVLALDMTAQDFAMAAKAAGMPWSLAKGFDTACPVSNFIPKSKIPEIRDVRLWLKVDGSVQQDSSTSDMIFSVPYLISYMSSYITLEPGDLILTGSPAGQGPVVSGETIEAGLDIGRDNLITMKFKVEQKSASEGCCG